MLILTLAVLGSLTTPPSPPVAPCAAAVTTIDLNACLAGRRDAAMHEVERYRAAARARLVGENPGDGALFAAFDAAQAAWLAYQSRQCATVAILWQGGSIRGAMALGCAIRMAQLRTHELWHDWLTYPDTTPPLLPEPMVEPGS